MGSLWHSVRASRRMRILIFLTILAFCSAAAQQERDGKVFSLFSVVQFKNLPCTSTDKISSASTQNRNGTCVTTSECIDRGGSAKGNCAAGFGVCCVKIIDEDSNTDVNYNDTYLQNPDYPSSYGDEGSITYKVNKLDSDICFLRLDFEQFDVIGISTTNAAVRTCAEVDHLEITGTELEFPAICGNLAGQHMYVSMGNDEGDNADIKVVVNGDAAGNTRKWEIKVAQIPCNSDYSPPEGCTQWFTEPSGTITDLGGSDMLQNSLDYNICVRQNNGYCCAEYQTCGTDGDFAIRTQAVLPANAVVGSGTNCGTDWISIDGAGASCGTITGINKFCNDILGYKNAGAAPDYVDIPICDCTPPFQIGVHTADTIVAAVVDQTGFCLNYRQVKC